MILKLLNKDTLIIDNFRFKCSIGKNGRKLNKIEGDKSTPRGKYELGSLYWRKDRIKKIETKLKTKVIKKSMHWCNDANCSKYNKEITKNSKIKSEKLYRRDYNYKSTTGCIAVSKKDFFIISKLINRNSKIII